MNINIRDLLRWIENEIDFKLRDKDTPLEDLPRMREALHHVQEARAKLAERERR
jgi:hypothetical protein